MSWHELVGLAAFLLNVVGNLMLARRRMAGWLVRLAAITAWGIYAMLAWSPSLLANAITFFGINCYGYWNWRRRVGHDERCRIKPCTCGRFA